MGQIIFSVDLKKKAVTLANNSFFKLFSTIDLPYLYTPNDELVEIVLNAQNSLQNSDLGRIFINKDEQVYLFDIDKVQDDILIFSGKKYNTKKHFRNEEIYKLLRLLSDNLPDMLWAKDVQGKYIFANKAICENLLMAENTEEPVGKGDVFFALREREKYKEIDDWHTFGELCFDSDEIVLQNMKPMRFEEFGNVKGKLLYLEVHKAPFFDEEGRLLGTVGSGRDITREVLAKNELKEKEQLLLRQSKMAAIGEMLQNIAHQWRQPLSSISSISTSVLVQKEINTLDDEYLITNMHNLNNYAQYLSKTIDDFRDFFKPNKEKTVFDFKGLEEKALSLISSKIHKDNIEIISNLESVKINGYENEFLQVLINILNNSIDALNESKVLKKVILIDTVKKTNKFIIRIKDNAGGIPDEIINNVFDPYFTTKHKMQGTGIGLYMSEEIITKHMNGTIVVKNKDFVHHHENYSGAEFKITLKDI